ncbi:hypothetical protein FHY31_002609 [Xanthomonas euvesicatoria]|nr:hypothetical protein [Xanthomonas euvesicatoria]
MMVGKYTGGDKVALGEKLYFFRSSITTDQCLIWGHAGLLWGHGQYQIPGDVGLYFFVPPGKRVKSSPTEMITSGWREPRVHVPRLHADDRVPDYILTKAVGSGFKGTRTVGGQTQRNKYSYKSVQDAMGSNAMAEELDRAKSLPLQEGAPGDWSPHVVSVRRRWLKGKTVRLSEVIDAVRAHDATVRRFYFGGCRGDISDSWLKSAFTKAAIAFIA